MAALSIGVATMSSVAQIQDRDTEKQRQCTCMTRGWLGTEMPDTSNYLWCIWSC